MFEDKYKTGVYNNPSDAMDPAQKPKDYNYFLRKSEWFYSLYVRDMAFIPFSKKKDFIENRLYAQGRQSTLKYLNILAPLQKVKAKQNPDGTTSPETQSERKGMMNISWDIESPMPKFRMKIIGLLNKVDFNATAQCIDETSDIQRNKMKFRKWAIKQNEAFLAGVKEAADVEPSQDDENVSMPFEPESLEQLDMIDKIGGFKLWMEIAMQKLVKYGYDLSEWEEIKTRMIEDAVDLGYIGMKDYTNRFTQRAQVEYVDPEFFVGRQSRLNDNSDMSEAGQIKFFTIQTLRETGEFTDAELRNMAYNYRNMIGNGTFSLPNTAYNQQYDISDHSKYLNFRVAVLDWEFESTDTEVFQQRMNDEGQMMFFPSDYNYQKEGKSSGRETYAIKKRKRFYRVKWCIGTKKVYDYGYQYDVPHHNDDEPRSSFSMYKISDRSIVNQCISSLDSLQIGVLKYRNAVAKAAPSGIAVEFGSLENITIGGDIMNPMDVLTIRRDTGDYIYRASVNDRGQPLQGVLDPIKEIKGGIGPILTELILCFDMHIKHIQDLTGISQVIDASAPGPNTQVGTAKIAEASTNDVLRPLLSAVKNVKRRGARNMASRWQIIALYAKDDIRAMVTAVGSAYTEIIRIGADKKDAFGLATYGINFEATIDDAMIARIDAAALESMKMGKNGMPGISMKDYVFILRMLELGEVKLAEVYLAYREQVENQRHEQLAAQNQQMAEAGANQLEALKGENMKAEIILKTNAEIAVIRAKGEEDRKTITWELQEDKRLGVVPKSIV